MRISDLEIQMSNLKEFRANIWKYGFSANNLYDVIIEIPTGGALYKELQANNLAIPDGFLKNNLRLYCDEASMPGVQMSTGEYRVTNSPQLKYVYGTVFSELSLSFLMDAENIIKGIFDIWTNWMYGYSSGTSGWSATNRFRANYRDDYAVDIIIVKYEKPVFGKGDTFFKGSRRMKREAKNTILPDSKDTSRSKFFQPVPVHATRIFNAFPANIASIPLAYGETSLNKFSVGFEYESYTTTAINDGKIRGVKDSVNGGFDLDLGDFFGDLVRGIFA